MKQEKHTMYLYGKNPLKEVLAKCKRENISPASAITRLLLTKETRDEKEMASMLDRFSLKAEIVTQAEIENLVGRGANHQGVCAVIREEMLYTSYDELLKNIRNEKRVLLLLLDELEDPHNVGAIIRSAVAFGAKGVILPEHRAAHITDTVIKTSSGMNFAIPIVKVTNVNLTIEKLKEERFWVYGLGMEGATELPKTEYDEKSLLIIGSEGKGVREKTKELCDFTIAIPMEKICESLNASVACAVALYEWKRQGE